jgi:hypothetical protein
MKIINFFNKFRATFLFKKLNLAVPKNYNTNNKNKKNVLVEFNAFCFMHIILSAFLNVLKKNNYCNFYAYRSHLLLSYDIEYNFIEKIKKIIAVFFNIGTFGIYKSLGISNFIEFKIDNKIRKLSLIKKNKIIKTIKKKQDINNIKINGVLIGDLIYDTFLKKNYDLKPTIDINSERFLDFLEKFLQLYFLWNNFIIKKKINLVLCSHNVYTLGIPSRICAHNNGEAFIIEHDRLTRLNKNNIFKYSITKKYKSMFSKLKKNKQLEYIRAAKKSLKSRFEGSLEDLNYMTSTAFSKNKVKNEFLKFPKNTYKVLVAPHDFVDAPHVYGKFIFPDMYEWIKYLCNLSKSSSFTWLIKTHPIMNEKYKSYQAYTRKVIDTLIKDSKFTLVDPNTSHNELIKKYKVNCVLTVSGTIAHEYAYHGIKVINASSKNMHEAYKFNLHAKNLGHYEEMIKNIHLRPNFNINELASCYYMHYDYCDKNWFFRDLNSTIKNIHGYHNLNTYKIYEEWLKIYSEKYFDKNLKNIEYFINSRDLVFTKKNKKY